MGVRVQAAAGWLPSGRLLNSCRAHAAQPTVARLKDGS